MIVKQVGAGAKTAGLLAYLYGPGVGEARGGTVHLNPRTIASWDGQPQLHAAVTTQRGRLSVGAIARTLDAPVQLADRAPRNHVGHIVVANHPDDPVLSDRQWQRIAADVMKRAGLARGVGDPDAVRWIAVRHDDTSVHIAYTKVRESGRPHGYVNYSRAWEQLRHDWEARLGLTPTGRADGGSRCPYDKAEFARAKAQRFAGDSHARPDTAKLRHECRVAAVTSRDEGEYEEQLNQRGIETDGIGGPKHRVGVRGGALRDAARLDPELAQDRLGSRWAAAPPSERPQDRTTRLGAHVSCALAAPGALDHDTLVDALHIAGALTGAVSFVDAAESLSVSAQPVRPADASVAELRARASVLACLPRATSEPDHGRNVKLLALALAALVTEVARSRHSAADVRVSLAYRKAGDQLLRSAVGVTTAPSRDDSVNGRVRDVGQSPAWVTTPRAIDR